MAIYEQTLGADHWALAPILGAAGTVCWRAGDYDDAKGFFSRSLAALEAKGRDHDPVVVSAMKPYALLLIDLAEHEAARPYLERALRIIEGAHGHIHLDVARTIEMFGLHSYKKRDYDEARRPYERALEIREEVFGVGNVANGWNPCDQVSILALAGDSDG